MTGKRDDSQNQGNSESMTNNAQQQAGMEHITRVTVGQVVYQASQERGQITVQVGDGQEEVLEQQEIANLQAMFSEFKGQAPQ